MERNVVAVWGHAQQGKTGVIKRIARLIIRYYPEAEVLIGDIDAEGDIQLIIKIGKIKIGIESQGDPNSRLFESLPLFIEEECVLIICATRTSGATVNKVDELAGHGYQITWVTNHRSYEKDSDILNDYSANQLFDLIKDIIAGRI